MTIIDLIFKFFHFFASRGKRFGRNMFYTVIVIAYSPIWIPATMDALHESKKNNEFMMSDLIGLRLDMGSERYSVTKDNTDPNADMVHVVSMTTSSSRMITRGLVRCSLIEEDRIALEKLLESRVEIANKK